MRRPIHQKPEWFLVDEGIHSPVNVTALCDFRSQ
jgi:hypothetical protein